MMRLRDPQRKVDGLVQESAEDNGKVASNVKNPELDLFERMLRISE
jgi:hypothetical protein